MEDILIDLGNSVSIDTSDVFVGADQDIVSESEALVGPPGPPGPQGVPGRDGVDGQAATVTVGSTTTTSPGTNANVTNSGTSSAAVLNFSIPRGNQGEAATVSVGTTTTGAAGSNASVTNSGTTSDAILDFTIPQGIAGNAATITVGSVQTVAPEYPATVTNSGTTSAAVLDFNIPRGNDGAQGDPGQPGQAATVTVGSTTTGAAGTNASVTNSGTTSAAVLDFTIPRGADGADGQDGQDGAPGAAATIAVGSTSTGAAGSSASVTNSGTSSAAVFDFVIPKGDTGAAGADGADGADGYSPTATVSQSGGVTTITITDKNGTTTSSITIPTQLSDLSGTVSTAQIANSAVTSAKIDPSVLQYRAGDTYSLANFDIVFAGRQVTSGGVKKIYGTIALDKPVSSNVSSITFTPGSWCEAYGKDGTIYSFNTPTSSQLTFALSKVANGSNLVKIAISIVASVSNFTSNTPCVFSLYGNISFS